MKAGTGQHISASRCLHCSRLLDGATCVGDDDNPNPGDVTVCIYCGHIMAFANDLTLRELSKEEAIDVAGDPRIMAIQHARRRL